MKKRIQKEDRASEFAYMRLRETCFKIRSLGYVLGKQKPEEACELDDDDIWYGLALILKDIHDEVIHVAHAIEEHQIQITVRKKSDE